MLYFRENIFYVAVALDEEAYRIEEKIIYQHMHKYYLGIHEFILVFIKFKTIETEGIGFL